MLYVVCAVIFALGVYGLILSHKSKAKLAMQDQERRERRCEKLQAIAADRNNRLDFHSAFSILSEYEFFHADQAFQQFLYLKYNMDGSLKSGLKFHANHIVGVDLQDGLKNSVTKGTIVTQSNAKGGLTRAAIGGAALGGAGAIVGAVTAKRVSQATTQETHREVLGKSTLRIATSSPEVPIITLSVSANQGRDFIMRFQRLLAMRNQAA